MSQAGFSSLSSSGIVRSPGNQAHRMPTRGFKSHRVVRGRWWFAERHDACFHFPPGICFIRVYERSVTYELTLGIRGTCSSLSEHTHWSLLLEGKPISFRSWPMKALSIHLTTLLCSQQTSLEYYAYYPRQKAKKTIVL